MKEFIYLPVCACMEGKGQETVVFPSNPWPQWL